MPTIARLAADDLGFPPLESALEDPNGLLAAGGDLSVPRLLEAYRHGIFPWYEEPQPILWWSPDPRSVLFPRELHVSRSLRRVLRSGRYRVSIDSCFERVIEACAGPRRTTTETWIGSDMQRAYARLHRSGFAHSVETWRGSTLVGGLYGVCVGRVFFGESMFSLEADASKVALVCLAGQLLEWQFALIDCQQHTEHMQRMGARTIAREDFRAILERNTGLPAPASPWELTWEYSDEQWVTR